MFAGFGDGVQGCEQFSHGCHQSDLFALSCCQQTRVERLEDGIVPDCHKRSHVQGAPYLGASSPDAKLSTHFSAIAVQRCHAHQGGDASAAQLPKLGQLRQQRRDRGLAHALDAAQRRGQRTVVRAVTCAAASASISVICAFRNVMVRSMLVRALAWEMRSRWRSLVSIVTS